MHQCGLPLLLSCVPPGLPLPAHPCLTYRLEKCASLLSRKDLNAVRRRYQQLEVGAGLRGSGMRACRQRLYARQREETMACLLRQQRWAAPAVLRLPPSIRGCTAAGIRSWSYRHRPLCPCSRMT